MERNNLNTRLLPRAVPVYNVDGSLNQGGSITQEVDVIMTYKDHTEKATFAVCDLGDKDAVIGHTWLFSHNPEIDWKSGKLQFTRCPPSCKVVMEVQQDAGTDRKERKGKKSPLPVIMEEVEDESVAVVNSLEYDGMSEGDRLFAYFPPPQEVNATTTISQQLAEKHTKSAKPDWLKKTFEEIVPPQYHEYKAVFSKESFDELPSKKPWDHAIELKPGSEPHRCKIYPLSPNEQAELDSFLDENLKSGRLDLPSPQWHPLCSL